MFFSSFLCRSSFVIVGFSFMAGRFFSFCEGPPNDLAPLQISTSFFFKCALKNQRMNRSRVLNKIFNEFVLGNEKRRLTKFWNIFCFLNYAIRSNKIRFDRKKSQRNDFNPIGLIQTESHSFNAASRCNQRLSRWNLG